jgi:hypothetical protein
MLVLMFDLRLKNMWLTTMYIGSKNAIIMIVKYNEYLLLHLPMKVKKLLMFDNIKEVENVQSQVHFKDLFYSTLTSANTYRDLMSRKLAIFCWHFVDVEICKDFPCLGGAKNTTL